MQAVPKSLILVVDDDPSMRDVVVKGLTSESLAIVAAADAQDALARVADGDIDAVVTDLRMPGLSYRNPYERREYLGSIAQQLLRGAFQNIFPMEFG